jgi:microcystin-dependent protein
MANKKSRGYFFEKTSTTNASGGLIPGTRFLATDIPTEETFRRLVDSVSFILDKEDRAKEAEQGLVKIVSDSNAKTNVSPNDGFVYAAQVHQLPVLSELIQDIADLTQKVLVSATAKGSDAKKNDYEVGLSNDFITWLSGKVTGFAASIGSLTSAVSSINATISSILTTISTIQSDILAIQADLTALDGRVTSAEADILDHESRITTAEADIVSLQAAIVSPPDNRFLGEMINRAANVAPSASWLLCDGSAISRTTYATLFALIGTSYGAGNGSTTFNIPDFRGKTTRGYHSGNATFDAFVSGGADSVTLVENNIPEHTHTFTAANQDTGINSVHTGGTNVGYVQGGNSGATFIEDITVDVTGTTDVNVTTESAVDIKNPYLVVFTFIKAI